MVVALLSACKSDDDSVQGLPSEIEVLTLLTSGKWYQESIQSGSFTSCEKNTNIEFTLNGTVFVESFDDENGPCESDGPESGVYTLTNNREITITSDNILLSLVIDLITAELLVITTDEGETITLDRVQG